MSSKRVVKPLSKMTKAELARRAEDFEALYNAEVQKNREACTGAQLVDLVHERDIARAAAARSYRKVLGLEHMNLELSQERSLLVDLSARHRDLLFFRDRDIERLLKVMDAMRLLLKHPVSICPRCASVEKSDQNENVACEQCMKAIVRFKNSQQDCGTVGDTEV
jgi:hypothetical protein